MPQRMREQIIRGAFQSDDGFHILGEELLHGAIESCRFMLLRGGSTTYEAVLTVLVPVGDRRNRGAGDVDRLQAKMTEVIRNRLAASNARIDDKKLARVEAYAMENGGTEHGWLIHLPVTCHV
jgi:hypothetical protein